MKDPYPVHHDLIPRKRLIFYVCLLLTVALGFYPLNGQQERISFQRISLEEGLSQTIVEGILQDEMGFMWFTTRDGLNRYDGYDFKVLKNEPGNSNSLSHNELTTVFEDRDGILWIGTYNGGLNRYDPKTKKFTRFMHDPMDPASLSNNIVWRIYQDRSDILWIGTERGLNRLMPAEDLESGAAFIHYKNTPHDPSSLSHNSVRAICEDQFGNLWLGTDNGLDRMAWKEEDGKRQPVFIHHRNDPGDPMSLSHNIVRCLYKDRSGTLWIGTDMGLNKLIAGAAGEGSGVSRSRFLRYLNDPEDPGSLSHNTVYALYEDRQGSFWIGTNGGGLNLFDREKETFTAYVNDRRDPSSLSYNEVWSIYEDRSGVLWVGTYGGGICKLDRARKAFVHYLPDPDDANSLNQEIVWCIYEDRDEVLWIGTHGGGLNRFDRSFNRFTHYLQDAENPGSISSNVVRLVLEDRLGTLWIGTQGGGLCRFDRESEIFTAFKNDPYDPGSLSSDTIRALYEDRSGTLWVGTRGGGLNKMVSGMKKSEPVVFQHYRNDPADPNSISSDFIRVIYEDTSGIMWIGTLGGGLNRFDPEKEVFTHYRAIPGDSSSLSNDYIFTIHGDSAGTLWLGTYGGGLVRFDPGKEVFKSFTEEQGLPNNVVYGILEDENGNLWLSTNRGLARFNKKTESFRNYNVMDGLQSNEFNGGSFFRSPKGEMFFGGINGFNAFYPRNITDNPHIPPVVITSFQKLNKKVTLEHPLWETKILNLSHRDYFFSFEFSALDYNAPEKNRYAYKMKGLDKDWIYTDAKKRFATYTTLPPGNYVFMVKGSNNDGVWNDRGARVRITIAPPFWKQLWFIGLMILAGLSVILLGYWRRLKTVRLRAELKAAHDAQMSIMPQLAPENGAFDISGISIPANEVGGDFFDYVWLDDKNTRLGVFVGDVSGKAMKAAMTAVMASGMINSEAREAHSVSEIMTRVNRPLYLKTDRQVFTAACFASLDLNKKELIFANAGLVEPLLKSNGSVTFVRSEGPPYPLGSVKDHVYSEQNVRMKTGDVLILLTDGVLESQNKSKEFYGDERLVEFLMNLDTTSLSAKMIKEKIIEDVKRFAGNALQFDDMTMVVVKRPGKKSAR
jgi:ligand-binding sensor domain-containing protein